MCSWTCKKTVRSSNPASMSTEYIASILGSSIYKARLDGLFRMSKHRKSSAMASTVSKACVAGAEQLAPV